LSALGPGRHATLLTLEHSLPSGVYFVVLRQDEHSSSRRIVVVE
jgi:hypothetical protein